MDLKNGDESVFVGGGVCLCLSYSLRFDPHGDILNIHYQVNSSLIAKNYCPGDVCRFK